MSYFNREAYARLKRLHNIYQTLSPEELAFHLFDYDILEIERVALSTFLSRRLKSPHIKCFMMPILSVLRPFERSVQLRLEYAREVWFHSRYEEGQLLLKNLKDTEDLWKIKELSNLSPFQNFQPSGDLSFLETSLITLDTPDQPERSPALTSEEHALFSITEGTDLNAPPPKMVKIAFECVYQIRREQEAEYFRTLGLRYPTKNDLMFGGAQILVWNLVSHRKRPLWMELFLPSPFFKSDLKIIEDFMESLEESVTTLVILADPMIHISLVRWMFDSPHWRESSWARKHGQEHGTLLRSAFEPNKRVYTALNVPERLPRTLSIWER